MWQCILGANTHTHTCTHKHTLTGVCSQKREKYVVPIPSSFVICDFASKLQLSGDTKKSSHKRDMSQQ
jgi:hypothetical protein